MPFFTYYQNNSGGHFDYNEDLGISHYVIVEADNAEEADNRAKDIGLYFDGRGDCPCCGRRWGEAYDSSEIPEIYGVPAEKYKPYRSIGDTDVFIHHKDRRVEKLSLKTRSSW